LDQREAERKARRYAIAARDVVKFDKAVLFGSFAYGRPEEYSDIDIGLFTDRLDDNVDYLKLMSSLYHVAMDIDVLIEPHLFIHGEDKSGFGVEIEKKRVVIEENR
jgi:predicted nucleotidyltransferase